MNLKSIIKGTALSVIFAVAILFIVAVLVYFNLLSEQSASIVVFGGAMIGIFIGSLGVAKASENKILINSLTVAFLFSLIIIITSLIINHGFELHTRTITLIGSTFAASFLGALFGK